jgi:hypothetical protein
VLSTTLNGYLDVPIAEPFEEPFWVPGRTLQASIKNPFQRGFDMEPKRVIWGQLNNPFGTLFPKHVYKGGQTGKETGIKYGL